MVITESIQKALHYPHWLLGAYPDSLSGNVGVFYRKRSNATAIHIH